MDSKALKKQLHDAREYIGKIGCPERHFTPMTFGRLHSVEIETQICFQESSGSNNYWKSAYFDSALETVIKVRFAELARAALDLLADKYRQARLAEKEDLQRQLAEIEALEREE